MTTDISVASSVISVNACVVADASLRVIADLLFALGDAHTPRALVRAVAASLSEYLPVRRVELGPPAPIAAVEREGGAWRAADPTPDPSATVIASGLAIVATRPLPA